MLWPAVVAGWWLVGLLLACAGMVLLLVVQSAAHLL